MRTRAWIFVGLAGLSLAVLAQVDLLSPAGAAAVTVASTIGLALLAHGGVPLASESVVLAAGGALAYEAVRPFLPLVATGLLLAFVFGTRAMRSRSVKELLFHLGVAFASGVAASWVATTHQGLETSLWLIAVVLAAVVASIPWILPADAPRTFALRKLAAQARGPMRVRLLRAVVAHRRIADLELPPRLRRRVERSIDELRRRVEPRLERRAGVGRDVSRLVDQLVRVARAARERESLLEGLDGEGEALAMDSEQLEAEVAALVELR